MKKILKLALTDFKLIFRDSTLDAFLVLPVIIYALLIWFVPGLVDRYEVLAPYLPLFLVIGVLENTQVFSFISSMVLVDEKEIQCFNTVWSSSNFQYPISGFTISLSIFDYGSVESWFACRSTPL